MNAFRKLPGHQRSPAGLEWRIWKRLHWIGLAGTVLPMAAAVAVGAWSSAASHAGAERAAEQFLYVMLGCVSLNWTLVLALAIACAIVIVMKGPAYAADPFPGEEPSRVSGSH